MERIHHMPFGAELGEDGHGRFRLWAPEARSVDLCIGAGGREHISPMDSVGGGWYGITIPAAAESRYRFRIDSKHRVPDPASRYQPEDVHGPSEIVDPRAYVWRDARWQGRPWGETILYELHVGAFTPLGTFTGVIDKLDHLAALGVTAIELMPVADFPGSHNWGYDGVLPFAPDSRYGHPDDMKALVDAAHDRGLMVFLDVVYNHFGPEGNYLHLYAPTFFTDRGDTPWGTAINLDGDSSHTVRNFFIHNALYWLEEFHIDGLRLDAVHALIDDSEPDFLTELAERVAGGPGATRHVHLVLENDDNAAHYLARDEVNRPRWYVAQWNDDIHHVLHVLTTGEAAGYYGDYASAPAHHLARCLTEGFAWQGEPSPYRQGQRRGESTGELPPTAFVSFLQNHDQVGNRAFGERITALASPAAVRAATAVLLLAPSPPLLFMGQEWGASQPFPFFCDFGQDLARAVTEGRRREFARFPKFADEEARRHIPDPNEQATFDQAVLRWDASTSPTHREWMALHQRLLELRTRVIAPHLPGMSRRDAHARQIGDRAVEAQWILDGGKRLLLLANLSNEAVSDVTIPAIPPLYAPDHLLSIAATGVLAPWAVLWYLLPSPHHA
jgi:maltooligosyltrehalose trehalohydrolase